MKILLSCSKTDSPSFQFYKESLTKLVKENKKINFTAKKFEQKILEKDYDVVLFMSGTKNSNFIKKKGVLYGVVDPRAGNYDDFLKYDFIIANGIEEKIFFSFSNLPTLIYPVYPSINLKRNKKNKNKTVIAYHGNREHLTNMYPRITNAFKKLATEHRIELILIYDYKRKGKINIFKRVFGVPKSIAGEPGWPGIIDPPAGARQEPGRSPAGAQLDPPGSPWGGPSAR